jgi:hypothetical protein
MRLLDAAGLLGESRQLAIELPQGRKLRLVEVLYRDNTVAGQLMRCEELIEFDMDRQAVLIPTAASSSITRADRAAEARFALTLAALGRTAAERRCAS